MLGLTRCSRGISGSVGADPLVPQLCARRCSLGETMNFNSSPHRKTVIATTAIAIVLATNKGQGLNWAGVVIEGYLVWIFLGLAHLYFTVMWWSNYGFEGWFPWKDGWKGIFTIPFKILILRWLTLGPFTMIAVIVGAAIICYQLAVVIWERLCS
jgi:hypothetical protein